MWPRQPLSKPWLKMVLPLVAGAWHLCSHFEQLCEPLICFGVIVGIQDEFLPDTNGFEYRPSLILPPSFFVLVIRQWRLIGKRIHPRGHTPYPTAISWLGQLQRKRTVLAVWTGLILVGILPSGHSGCVHLEVRCCLLYTSDAADE